jgi:hypothetical protein
MRRLIFISFLTLALAGCDDGTAPSTLSDAYALARIGVQTPPIPQGPSGGAPFLIADTLRLDNGRPREESGRVLTRILVVQDASGTDHRMESEHVFTIENGLLTYDSCPRDALCIASLVYAPMIFQIVGDSLFQIPPPAFPAAAAVYGAVR